MIHYTTYDKNVDRYIKDLDYAARWLLAGAYFLIGRKEVSEVIIKNLSTSIAPYHELADSFGSDLRDQAIILEVLVLMGENKIASKVSYSFESKIIETSSASLQSKVAKAAGANVKEYNKRVAQTFASQPRRCCPKSWLFMLRDGCWIR